MSLAPTAIFFWSRPEVHCNIYKITRTYFTFSVTFLHQSLGGTACFHKTSKIFKRGINTFLYNHNWNDKYCFQGAKYYYQILYLAKQLQTIFKKPKTPFEI